MLPLEDWLVLGGAAIALSSAAAAVGSLERRRIAKHLRHLPPHYLPKRDFAKRARVYAGLCALWLAAALAGQLNAAVGFVLAIGFFPCLIVAVLSFERPQRRAVVADVRERAASMSWGELDQLVTDLERAYGRLQPLRELVEARRVEDEPAAPDYQPQMPRSLGVVIVLAVGLFFSPALVELSTVVALIALVGFTIGLVLASRSFLRARRVQVDAIMADVRRRAPSMSRAQLARLVKDLERRHGGAMKPLRELVG
jgi:uncharacterized membrane protein YciS (DUF1049 family)